MSQSQTETNGISQFDCNGRFALRLKRLPVLLYHHVGPARTNTYQSLTLSPARFERQVSWLARRGYAGVRPSDWLAYYRAGAPLPAKPVLLTFDDAYADLVDYALPVLRCYGFKAAVFVVTGQVGGTNAWDEARGSGTHRLMTDEQIREWSTQGIEFGAHSRTHANLTNLADEELKEEIAGSGKDLASILGAMVISFAYPNGSYDKAVQNYVREAFPLAFTVEEGLNDLRTDPCLLRRTMVQPGDSLIDLACRVRLGWSPILHLRSSIARVRHRLQGRNG